GVDHVGRQRIVVIPLGPQSAASHGVDVAGRVVHGPDPRGHCHQVWMSPSTVAWRAASAPATGVNARRTRSCTPDTKASNAMASSAWAWAPFSTPSTSSSRTVTIPHKGSGRAESVTTSSKNSVGPAHNVPLLTWLHASALFRWVTNSVLALLMTWGRRRSE